MKRGQQHSDQKRESGVQFRGAIDTLKVLPWRLPQLPQRSFRSRSSSLVYGGRLLQQPGINVGPLAAGGTGRDDQMPDAQISRVTLAAHETPLSH